MLDVKAIQADLQSKVEGMNSDPQKIHVLLNEGISRMKQLIDNTENREVQYILHFYYMICNKQYFCFFDVFLYWFVKELEKNTRDTLEDYLKVLHIMALCLSPYIFLWIFIITLSVYIGIFPTVYRRAKPSWSKWWIR